MAGESNPPIDPPSSSTDHNDNPNSSQFNGNPPGTPDSPTSAGFNTDQLPRTSENYSDSDDEAEVEPRLINDEPDEPVDEDDVEGEDLFNDNFIDDYRELGEQDQYESAGLDASFEDERNLDQIIRDRQAAEMELDNRDGVASQRKFPQLLHDQDTDDDSYRPSKRTRARPPGSPGGGSPPTSPPRGGGGPRGPPSDTDDTDVPMTDAFEHHQII
ncbi:DNA replication licensing factor MCM2 [Artemisia annua]|uniref:DNA replication licensing factor MCM2 n=1 Tax=Artemisia annua TaxID=35608 RepID=A0A2U1KZ44_ARTAN|nr:DNA replication licensing factor MCM2 [Artemisia annua]